MRITLPFAATALAAVLAALAPARAAAGGWQLRTGAEYGQSDTWAVDGPKSTTPRLDLDLGLAAYGSLLGKGMIDWSADAQYNRSAVDGDGTVQDRLSYGLRSALLGGVNGPVALTGYATRRDEHFSTEGQAAGSSLANSYGGDFLLRGQGSRPWLRGSYGWSESEADTIALGRTSRSHQSVGASTGFGAATFSYNASYQGSFSEGSFETDRYQTHQLEVGAEASVASDTKVRVGNFYYQRNTPQVTSINARQESQGASATLLHAPIGGIFQSAGYAYAHAAQETSGGTVERLQHRASYSAGGQLPAPEWTLRGALDATLDEDRRPTGTSRSTSQSLSASAAWRRTRDGSATSIHGGPTVGVQEPAQGEARVGWGVNAGVSHQRSATVQTGFGYDVGFNQDIGPDDGWAFRQALTGSASMRVGLASISGTLQAAADRRESLSRPVAASRSLTGIGAWRLRRTEVNVQLAYQDNTSGKISSGTIGDGLFIAPAYDSRTAYAALTAGTALGRLGLRGRARYGTVDLPDRPVYDEAQFSGSIDYAYGALRIAVEDTYVVTEVEGGRFRVNQLMIKAYRVFGSRF